jgi:hypothetical protein
VHNSIFLNISTIADPVSCIIYFEESFGAVAELEGYFSISKIRRKPGRMVGRGILTEIQLI